MSKTEYLEEGERLYDAYLYPYDEGDVAGRLRSSNLLYNSFEAAGVGDDFHRFITAVSEWAGRGRTVWAAKLIGGQLRWELYFYDYLFKRQLSVTSYRNIIAPFFVCPEEAARESCPYFVFSSDLGPEH